MTTARYLTENIDKTKTNRRVKYDRKRGGNGQSGWTPHQWQSLTPHTSFHIVGQDGVSGPILRRQPEHSKCYGACGPSTSGRLHPGWDRQVPGHVPWPLGQRGNRGTTEPHAGPRSFPEPHGSWSLVETRPAPSTQHHQAPSWRGHEGQHWHQMQSYWHLWSCPLLLLHRRRHSLPQQQPPLGQQGLATQAQPAPPADLLPSCYPPALSGEKAGQ